jgi:hypothetical protein
MSLSKVKSPALRVWMESLASMDRTVEMVKTVLTVEMAAMAAMVRMVETEPPASESFMASDALLHL